MSEFLHMGGYAAFVWSSYALTFVLMTLMIVFSASAHKKKRQMIQGRLRRAENEKLEQSNDDKDN